MMKWGNFKTEMIISIQRLKSNGRTGFSGALTVMIIVIES